jgi:hypothetical protein
MLAVPSMYRHALNTVAVMPAGSGTGTMIFTRNQHFLQESTLQLPCGLVIATIEERHSFDLKSVVVDHAKSPFPQL